MATAGTRGDELTPPVRIDALANGGAGIARLDGRVVFVPHTAVGDRVRCRLIQEKKHYAVAEAVEILSPSAQRRRAPCPVAGRCGGCQWQHLVYAEQLAWKERLYRDSLIRQCRVEPERIRAIVPAAAEFGYRSRVQVKCFNSRSGFITGFYRPKSRYVVAAERCPIIADPLNSLLVRLRNGIDGTAWARHIPQIDLAIDDAGKCSVTVHFLGENHRQLTQLLISTCPEADILLQQGTKQTLAVVRGNAVMEIHVDRPPLKLNYAIGGFAQINLEQNRKLVDRVVHLANLKGTERVIDLYCGMGNFSLPLARRCRSLSGVEEAQRSIDYARNNALRHGLGNCDFRCASALDGFHRAIRDENCDLLILDPPRSGAYEIVKALIKNPAERVIYVSCDPQTLARDLEVLLHNGYRLICSQPFDLFPQTHHCESVTLLQRG